MTTGIKVQCNTMYMRASLWTVLLLAVHGILTGDALSDYDGCVLDKKSNKNVLKTELCMAVNNDILITCPPNENIVLESLKFAVKQSADVCTTRVLAARNAFCCRVGDSDILYDDGCLQDVWSSEDIQQYKQFMLGALRKCMNTNFCTLGRQMFSNLQRQIPRSGKYSSYIQVRHQCAKEPVDPVNVCSSASKKGKEIHIQGTFTIGDTLKKGCICRVTSHTPVTVRAVDVRTYNSRLILRSDNKVKDISSDQLPIFGFTEIFTGRTFDMMLQNSTASMSGYMWIQLSGYNGRTMSVECGDLVSAGQAQSTETVPRVKFTPRSPVGVTGDKKTSGLSGYGHMIYAAVGSGLTLSLTAFIFGGYFLCRYCMKKGRHSYEKPYDRQFSGQYDAVYGGMPHPPPEWMNTGVKQDQRTSTMRSLHKPMAPTLPPPNKHGLLPSDHTQSSHNPMTASGTSDFDPFLGN